MGADEDNRLVRPALRGFVARPPQERAATAAPGDTRLCSLAGGLRVKVSERF